MERREFLAASSSLLAATLLLPGCAEEVPGQTDAGGAPVNEDWETLAGDLEAVDVFSASDPGPWEGKEGSHAPFASVLAGLATVMAEHGMEADHWITVVYARDQDGVVIGLAELEATDGPCAEFMLPEGTTEVTPYAHCNQHGLWVGDPVPVS